ncbi:MAG TPA: hypothetical protein VEQ37_16715 [Actinomycetota bacterium]|nr:hypothetical protein [Actinomycetota bacterium]
MSRKLPIVLLVLLVLLLAVPLGMGMAMGMCSTSHASSCPSAVGTCAAIVAMMLIVAVGLLGRVQVSAPHAPRLLLVSSLERPPRLPSF